MGWQSSYHDVIIAGLTTGISGGSDAKPGLPPGEEQQRQLEKEKGYESLVEPPYVDTFGTKKKCPD